MNYSTKGILRARGVLRKRGVALRAGALSCLICHNFTQFSAQRFICIAYVLLIAIRPDIIKV